MIYQNTVKYIAVIELKDNSFQQYHCLITLSGTLHLFAITGNVSSTSFITEAEILVNVDSLSCEDEYAFPLLNSSSG